MLGGTGLRFVVSILVIVMFATLVDDAPIKSFLLSFFLGYVLLTALELGTALGRSPDGNHA